MYDDEMEEPLSQGGDFELDLDYEFDAPRYFDLSRPESPSEGLWAEHWFDSAGSYPPSPLVTDRDTREAGHMESINTLSNLKGMYYTNLAADTDFTVVSENHKGSTLDSCIPQDVLVDDVKCHVKGPSSRGSTLMKPTASQLAKQNRPHEVKKMLWNSFMMTNETSFEDPNDHTSQAAKRQRLEGGHMCKVNDARQHPEFTHKVPGKKNESAECNARLPRLKLTVPREPMLETAKRATTYRAQRQRSKNAEDSSDEIKPIITTFKARPINRKILKVPTLPLPQKSTPTLPQFQEFRLKTKERAIRHLDALSPVIADNRISGYSMRDGLAGFEKIHQSSCSSKQFDDKKIEICGNTVSKFRARPLNKKIISSKGDMGIYRSNKRETTKTKEFKFLTDKCQNGPLTELFNKLSLASEAQPTSSSSTRLQQPIHKGVKRECNESSSRIKKVSMSTFLEPNNIILARVLPWRLIQSISANFWEKADSTWSIGSLDDLKAFSQIFQVLIIFNAITAALGGKKPQFYRRLTRELCFLEVFDML